jgi:Outer membrane protein beta-barrel domain
MKRLTDQELDSIFKNAADGYEPAFDSAAWDAMNAKLDQPKPTIWKRWMTFMLLGAVIFSTGVWVGTRISEKRLLTESLVKSKGKESIQQKSATTQNNQAQIATRQASVEQQTPIKSEQQEIVVDQELNRILIANYEVLEKRQSSVIIDTIDVMNEFNLLLQEEKNSNEFITSVSDNQADTVEQQIIADEVKIDTTQPINSDIRKERKDYTDRHTIFLRALASPDFSSINYSSSSQTGSNYSLLMEYQLTKRWSISTGGIWSMKKYSEDSEVTYGKFTADRMVGSCQILDIPVNIYYRFRPQLKTSFYAGLGLSSYIMLEEDYTYTVDYSSGSRDYSYYIEGKNNEWFKMLNLSVGVQYQVAPRFYVQVEPFLKAPLAGVGEWDVQLSSMGIFLGIKYKIN